MSQERSDWNKTACFLERGLISDTILYSCTVEIRKSLAFLRDTLIEMLSDRN